MLADVCLKCGCRCLAYVSHGRYTGETRMSGCCQYRTKFLPPYSLFTHEGKQTRGEGWFS